MLVLILLWSGIFFIFLSSGYAFFWLSGKLMKTDENLHLNIDEYFFAGFLSISALSGLLSIFIPMDNVVFTVLVLFAAILLYFFSREIIFLVKDLLSRFGLLGKTGVIALLILFFLVLAAAVYKITFEDSLTYHAQNIQWIQKYAVVPGLGNLHGRFAFNNMFFVVSAIFSFKIGDSLIFPLNGLCFFVLIVRLFTLFILEFNTGKKWKAVFYILIILMGLLILVPNLSSPAPDIICDILIIYSFVIIIRKIDSLWQPNKMHFILICLIVFSCTTYKISSLLLTPVLLFFLVTEKRKKLMIAMIIGSFILIPFLVRNYYLSGYIIYPFPATDIFNPDWKIPIENVSAMKIEIESFAKIVGMPYAEVDAMHFSEWMIPWFAARDFTTKVILIGNLLSFIILIFTIIKKESYTPWLFIVIYLNIFFWLSTAPDPRFVHGFLFTGFALSCAYIIKIIESSGYYKILRSLKLLIISLFIVIVLQRISFPSEPFRDPMLFAIPAKFETTPTEIRKAVNFEYRMALNPENCCYFTEIPCVTYPLDNLMLRGTDFQDGFRISIQN